MAKKSRADSTEALLDVIRGDGDRQVNFRDSGSPGANLDARSAPSSDGRGGRRARRVKKRKAGPRLLGMARNAVVGIDLGVDHVTMVKMGKGAAPRLLDIQTMPLASPEEYDAPEFPERLRGLVGRVCGSNCEIWALHRAADVDVSTVSVPRLTGGKLSNAVYWQLQKERKFSDKEFVLDYRVQRQIKDGNIPKVEALACMARRRDVERIRSIIKAAGYRLSGITIIPSAFQNIYRTGWVASGGGLTASLHVGGTFSCITIYDGADIRFSRTIKFGLDSMAEELAENYNQNRIPGARRNGELMDVDAGRRLVLARLLERRLEGGGPGRELDKQTVFDSVQDSLERVARQAERTLDYYAQNFGSRCERLHLSGRLFGSDLVADYISSELALDMEVFDPLGGLDHAAVAGLGVLSDRLSRNEAVAVALSDSEKTLNLHENYAGRERTRHKTLLGNAVAVAAMLLAMVLAGLFVWRGETNTTLESRLAEVQSQIRTDAPVDEAALGRAVAEVGAQQKMLQRASRRYEALAVLAELGKLTPGRVRMLNLGMELTRPQDDGEGDAGADAEAPVRLMVLEAVIVGDPSDFETELTRYLIGLKSSPLFGDVVVQTSEVRPFVPDGDVLHVVLHIQLA